MSDTFPLILTVPHMKGQRVKDAQWLLKGNNRYKKVWYRGSLDGDFGPATAAAAKQCKWDLGYAKSSVNASWGTLLRSYMIPRKVAGSKLRTPTMVARAKLRAQVDPTLAKARSMVAFGKLFDNGYYWGGEHDGSLADDSPHGHFDCSSSVSFFLYHFGLMPSRTAQVSGWFERYGDAGRGKYVTIHASGDHVWVEFTLPEGYCRFDTSPHGCGTRGPRIRYCRRSDYTFVARHPRGM